MIKRFCFFILLTTFCINRVLASNDNCDASAWINPVVGEQVAMFNMNGSPLVGTNYGDLVFDKLFNPLLLDSIKIVVDNKSAALVRMKYGEKCLGGMTINARFHIELRQERNRTTPNIQGVALDKYYVLVIDELENSHQRDSCICSG